MNLIVAVDNNWAIGSKNELLIRIPNDHKHFREETTGKVVVLGRKTLETTLFCPKIRIIRSRMRSWYTLLKNCWKN